MRTLGVERERFIIKLDKISPSIGILLPALQKQAVGNRLNKYRFGYELFAGQVEDRTPVALTSKSLISYLKQNDKILYQVGNSLGLSFSSRDYIDASELGELIVNPFDERHKSIWQKIPYEKKVAASQVAAIHVHVGVTLQEAVMVLNYCRLNIINEMIFLGNFSQGLRLRAYRAMAGVTGEPPLFADTKELLAYIKEAAGERNIWDMVRYKPTTRTIEFRMFGTTDNYNKIRTFILASVEVITQACS